MAVLSFTSEQVFGFGGLFTEAYSGKPEAAAFPVETISVRLLIIQEVVAFTPANQ